MTDSDLPLGHELEELAGRLADQFPAKTREQFIDEMWGHVRRFEAEGFDPAAARRHVARGAYQSLGESPLKAGGDLRGRYAVGCLIVGALVALLLWILL